MGEGRKGGMEAKCCQRRRVDDRSEMGEEKWRVNRLEREVKDDEKVNGKVRAVVRNGKPGGGRQCEQNEQ